ARRAWAARYRGPAAWLRSPGHRLQDGPPLQVGLEGGRDAHGAVGLLVGLEDRDDGARDRHERAVERGHRGRAVLAAGADVEAARLEVGAVRGRGELAVLALARDPRLAVELALRREPEV